jgi:hypothetical protein
VTGAAGPSDGEKTKTGADTANDTPRLSLRQSMMHQGCLMRHGKASKPGAGAIPDTGRIKRCSSARPLEKGLPQPLH